MEYVHIMLSNIAWVVYFASVMGVLYELEDLRWIAWIRDFWTSIWYWNIIRLLIINNSIDGFIFSENKTGPLKKTCSQNSHKFEMFHKFEKKYYNAMRRTLLYTSIDWY